jgi:hypothetical protein
MDFHPTQQMCAVYPTHVQQQQFQYVSSERIAVLNFAKLMRQHQQLHGVAFYALEDQHNLQMPYANAEDHYETLPTYSAEPLNHLPVSLLGEHERHLAAAVHAPLPISPGPQFGDGGCFSFDGGDTTAGVITQSGYYTSVDYSTAPVRGNIVDDASQGWLGTTFPTPSELLVELAANNDSSAMRRLIISAAASPVPSASPESSENSSLDQTVESQRSSRSTSRSSSVSVLPEIGKVK